MNEIFWDYILTAIPLAFIAWLCAFISRPYFEKKWTKITSQTVSVLLLIMVYLISKGMSEDKNLADTNINVLLTFTASFFIMKFVAMYLIACYAKSVNKSPYWSFVGVLNFLLALPLLIFGLWKSENQSVQRAQGNLTHDEMINGLKKIVDNPDTPQEKRDWATDRLASIKKIKS